MKFGDELDLCGHEIQNFGVEQRSTYRTNPIGGQLQGHGEHLAYYNGVKWITLADNSKFSNYALATHDHDTIYEPILPPSGIDAELKYLNGNRLWSEIQVSPYSFMRNLYLSHEPSIYGGSLSNEPDTPTPIDTLLIANAEWIIGTFVGGVLEVDTIDKGTWTFNLNMHVELGFTAIVDLTIEVYSLNQSFNQVLLFSKVETELTMSDQAEQFVFSYEVPSIPIDPTLKLIVVLKATSLSDCTLTIQTGPLCYITMPYRMSHTILSEYNKNPLFQHINASDRTILNNTSGKNTGDETEESIISKIGTDGQIKSDYLPSYVDDVIEGYYFEGVFYSDIAHTEIITAEQGKIYVDIPTNFSYRYSGTSYINISNPLDYSTDIENDKASTTKISAIKTFYDWAVGKFIDLTKIVTSWNATTLNTNIPSEKLVKDSLGLKADITPANGSTSALRALFIARGYDAYTNTYHCVYNSNTGFYEMNGITDLTESEMLGIYAKSIGLVNMNMRAVANYHKCRTLYPLFVFGNTGLTLTYLNINSSVMSHFRCHKNNLISEMVGTFYNCTNLIDVQTLNIPYLTNVALVLNCFNNCPKLVTAYIKSINVSFSFAWSPLLSLASLQYLVNNRANGTTRITITVHATVWSKLNDAVNYPEWNALLVDAVNNQFIDFASA